LTATVIYPRNAFRLAIVSNISPQILAIFGNFVHQLAAHLQQHELVRLLTQVHRYGDKNLHLRW